MVSAQRRALAYLARGWILDPAGKDGLAGHLFTKGVKGYPVSVMDMNRLFSEMLIEFSVELGSYVLTKQGREFNEQEARAGR